MQVAENIAEIATTSQWQTDSTNDDVSFDLK